jgi:hypothetical protein
MALPSSGQLSFSAIAGELSVSLSNVSLRSMSSTAGFSTPDSVSEFYGYSASSVTYTYYSYYAAGDPCNYEYYDIYEGSDGIYYIYLGGGVYDPMYNTTDIWYEYLYYEPLFGQNVYTMWEVNSFSDTLTDQGLVLSYC